MLYTVFYTRVPILRPATVPDRISYLTQLTAMHIHHAARLESIPVQVIEYLSERVRRIIGIGQRLLSHHPVGSHVHVDVHGIFHVLLPPVRALGRTTLAGSGKAKVWQG